MKNLNRRIEMLEDRIKALESPPDLGMDDIDPEELEKREGFKRFIEKHQGRTFESHQKFMEAVLEDAVFDPEAKPTRTDNNNPSDWQERRQAFRRFTESGRWPHTIPALNKDGEESE